MTAHSTAVQQLKKIPALGKDLPPIYADDGLAEVAAKLQPLFSSVYEQTQLFDKAVEEELAEIGDESEFSSPAYLPNCVVSLPVAYAPDQKASCHEQANVVLVVAMGLACEYGLHILDVVDINPFSLCTNGDEVTLNEYGAIIGFGYGLRITWASHGQEAYSQAEEHLADIHHRAEGRIQAANGFNFDD